MYFYRVSWSWYEEYDPKSFYSESKITQEDFDVMIKELINTVGLRLVADNYDGWIGNDEIMEGVWELLSEDGFHPLEYEASYNLWGSGIVDDDDEEYAEHLNPKTWEKINGHNQRLRDKLYS